MSLFYKQLCLGTGSEESIKLLIAKQTDRTQILIIPAKRGLSICALYLSSILNSNLSLINSPMK